MSGVVVSSVYACTVEWPYSAYALFVVELWHPLAVEMVVAKLRLLKYDGIDGQKLIQSCCQLLDNFLVKAVHLKHQFN